MTKEEVLATRFLGTGLEWRLFLGALILGLFLGALYDILRALRLSLKHGNAAVFFEDLFFAFAFGISFYSYCTELCRGQLRFFVFAAMLIGFAVYLWTLGRIVVKIVAKTVKIAGIALIPLAKVFKKTVGVLCGAPFFTLSSEKIEENPCTDADV